MITMAFIIDRNTDNTKLQKLVEDAKKHYGARSAETAIQRALEFVFLEYPNIREKHKENRLERKYP